MIPAYYNEIDPKAAQWLKTLTVFGAINPGHVDARCIKEVSSDDIRSFQRCHFFAGIGGWDLALQLAGWPEDQPVWTASLPCQPFSAAGKQQGTDDDRHLWPIFRDLVEQCQPAALFGEQVASKLGRAWLASVQADLEALGYRTAAADLCAASVNAPHIRQRLYWCAIRQQGQLPEDADPERDLDASGATGCNRVAVSNGGNPGAEGVQRSGEQRLQSACGGANSGLGLPTGQGPQGYDSAARETERKQSWGTGADGGLADSDSQRFPQWSERNSEPFESRQQASSRDDVERCGDLGGLAHDETRRWKQINSQSARCNEGSGTQGCKRPEYCGSAGGLPDSEILVSGGDLAQREPEERAPDRWDSPWNDVVYVPCADGKARPIKPGLEPLVNGLPGRVGLLRGYGNAIVPQVAAIFVKSVMECL